MAVPDRARDPKRQYIKKGIDRLEEESNKVYLADKANEEVIRRGYGTLVSPHHCLRCGAGDHKTEEC